MEWSSSIMKSLLTKIKDLLFSQENDDQEKAAYMAQYISINHREDDYGL